MANYRYYYTEREANFGKPLKTEVKGGAHLVFDVIPVIDDTVFALRLPEGLHGDRKNALYFPHGLIRFGEDTKACADRLCLEYCGVHINETNLLWLSSWVDENEHWHMCLNVIAYLKEPPTQREFVSEIVKLTRNRIVDDFPWWNKQELEILLDFINVNNKGWRNGR